MHHQLEWKSQKSLNNNKRREKFVNKIMSFTKMPRIPRLYPNSQEYKWNYSHSLYSTSLWTVLKSIALRIERTLVWTLWWVLNQDQQRLSLRNKIVPLSKSRNKNSFRFRISEYKFQLIRVTRKDRLRKKLLWEDGMIGRFLFWASLFLLSITKIQTIFHFSLNTKLFL